MTKVQFGKDHYHLQNEMIEWCKKYISPNYGWRKPDKERWGDDWGIVSMFGNSFFYFIEERNATLFALRWS